MADVDRHSMMHPMEEFSARTTESQSRINGRNNKAEKLNFNISPLVRLSLLIYALV